MQFSHVVTLAYPARLLVVSLMLTSSMIASEEMKYPLAVAVGGDGTVYAADRDLPGIWKFAEGRWSVYFQASKKFRTPLNAVRCLAIDHQGKLLAGDSATRDIYRFDDSNQPCPLTKGRVGIPMALAVANDGTIFVSDLESHRILKVAATGGEPSELAELAATRGLAIDKEGRLIAVCHGENSIVRISADGKEKTILVKGRPFQFSHHVAIGSKGELFIADGYAKTIWKVEEHNSPVAEIAGDPLKNPVGVAWNNGDLLIADPQLKGILKRTPDGKLVLLINQPSQ
ncbi:NHL repeat-containing protein [Schlesneria paludicola]|uniref:NHL repeat-containing protein n=1 Tax=Schlesneria paludicola TaxID=360056 RepID=UPI00029B478A|nr:NHL repeat-containing protein [Schlesneria paludicola]